MVSAVEGGQNPKSFSEIHPGTLLIGFVKNIKDYGVFVQFPSGLSGLAPKAVSSDSCTRAFEGRPCWVTDPEGWWGRAGYSIFS